MTRRRPSIPAAMLAAAVALLPFCTAPTAYTAPTAVRATQTPAPATVRATVAVHPSLSEAPTTAPPRTAPARANRSEHRPPLTGGPVLAHPHPASQRKQAPAPARRYVDLGTWRVTKYCSTGNRTASDTWPAIGEAATLDRGIPFGTLLRIVGRDTVDGRWIDQTFTVTDRIGHGSQLDLYAGGEGDPACEPRVNRTWGLQHLEVYAVLDRR